MTGIDKDEFTALMYYFRDKKLKVRNMDEDGKIMNLEQLDGGNKSGRRGNIDDMDVDEVDEEEFEEEDDESFQDNEEEQDLDSDELSDMIEETPTKSKKPSKKKED